ncbi:MAG TPA: hypothetical protein VL442_06750 [Mucilaginibacter sp.]|jgi:hypothetical protein|nr:hypothetical protein [Mucilaginibacter sp.]
MNVEQITTSIQEKMRELELALFYKSLDIVFRNDIEMEVVCFNGFTTVEGYETQVMIDCFQGLKDLIELRFMQELDPNKREVLTRNLLRQLELMEHCVNDRYEDFFERLNELQKIQLKEFETKQIELRDEVIINFRSLYKLEKMPKSENLERIVWLGPLDELSGLYHNLVAKGWIKAANDKDDLARTIEFIFDVKVSTSVFRSFKRYLQDKTKLYGRFQDIPSNRIKAKS